MSHRSARHVPSFTPRGRPPRQRRSAWPLLAGALMMVATAATADSLNVSVVSFADIRVAIQASARAEVVALTRTGVAARIQAPVERLDVDVGDRVAAGEIIAQLECGDFTDRLDQVEGRLDELEARRRLALTRLERTRRLRDQDAVSADSLDEAEAEVEALAASIHSQQGTLREARRAVSHCDVVAPFTGIVTARPVSTGEWVQPGVVVARLLDPAELELRAAIPSRLLDSAADIDDPEFRTDGQRYPVRLREAIAEVDPVTRTREVRLRFTGARPLIGTAGRLHWTRVDDAVPARLLVQRDGRLGVMLADGDRARFHELADAVAGRPAPAPTLDPDAELIVEGRQAARAGNRIRRLQEAGGSD